MTSALADGGYELHNLRDLGETPTPHGQIRSGRLFRSANPDGLTASGWQELVDMGIRSIVDLRNDYEPTESLRPAALTVLRRPIEDQADDAFMAEWGHRLGSPEYYPEILSRWPGLVAAAFSAVADARDGGVLIHCMAGRDRTGMMIAILLELLGAERDIIFVDYAAGVRAIDAWWRIHPGPERLPTTDQLELHLEKSRRSLNAFLDGIQAEEYLVSAGVTRQQIGRIRSRLLEA